MPKPLVRTLGIDPGLGCTGFAILDKKGELELSETMRSSPKDGSETARGTAIAQKARELAQEHGCDVVAVEWQHLAGIRGNQILKLTALRGAICALCMDAGARVIEVQPTEAKKRLTGRGDADKEYMQKWVLQRHSVEVSQDAADAVGIAHHGQEVVRLEGLQPALLG